MCLSSQTQPPAPPLTHHSPSPLTLPSVPRSHHSRSFIRLRSSGPRQSVGRESSLAPSSDHRGTRLPGLLPSYRGFAYVPIARMKLVIPLLLFLLYLVFRTVAADDASDCGLNNRGIEVTEMGTVVDQAGELTMVATLELAVVDPSLLNISFPMACQKGPKDATLAVLCEAVELDFHNYQELLKRGMGVEVLRREKRQVVAAGMIVSGLLGFLTSKLSSHPVAQLEGIVKKLRDRTQALDVEVHKLNAEVVAFSRLSLDTANDTARLSQDLKDLHRKLRELETEEKVLESRGQALAGVLSYSVTLDGIKSQLQHSHFAAARSFEGLVAGRSHRLSPSVIPPHLFKEKLTAIQERLQSKLGETVSFGSLESAYVASRVDFVDFKVVSQPDEGTRTVVELVWRTPFVTEKTPKAKNTPTTRLYRLQTHPFTARFREEKGEYYQLIPSRHLVDTGNGSFINRRPTAWVFSTKSPACEYAAVRPEAQAEAALDLCLQTAKPVKFLRGLETLESGCWLLSGSEGQLRQSCQGSHTQHIANLPQPGMPFLFKPKCGCKYTSLYRDYPLSGRGCLATDQRDRQVASLPHAQAQDFLHLFRHRLQSLNLDLQIPDNCTDVRTKRSVGDHRSASILAQLEARMSGATDTDTVSAAVADVAARVKAHKTHQPLDWHMPLTKEERGWLWWLNWNTLKMACLVVCGIIILFFVIKIAVTFSCFKSSGKSSVKATPSKGARILILD